MLGVLCLPPGPWAGSCGCVCTHSVREFIQTNIHTKGDVVSLKSCGGRGLFFSEQRFVLLITSTLKVNQVFLTLFVAG